MFRPSASSTYSSAESRMRTQALPPCCRMSGRISNISAPTAMTTYLFCRLMKSIMIISSGPVRHALAQQPRGPQRQHEDQHDESEDVGVVAAQDATGHHSDVAGADRFDQSKQDAAHHRAGQVADAAEHGRGERLQAGQ